MRLRRATPERPGATVRYAIDELNTDRVRGWAFDGDTELTVEVLVAGKVVGEAPVVGDRADVAQSLGAPDALECGFDFRFSSDHFAHVRESEAEVILHLRANGASVATAPVSVPVLGSHSAAVARAPLPPGVATLLSRLRPSVYEQTWDDALAERAVADLRLLLQRGPRGAPDLHAHLTMLGQIWIRAASVERYFPRDNSEVDVGAKDGSAVQSSAIEIFAIAAHFATAVAWGVDGPLLEFGCFKGFSTAILSDMCHQLGRPLHVFDSFAGLPPSDSAYYRSGEFAGSRAEVERNVAVYGRPGQVHYHEGFFADSLPTISLPEVAQLWMDVDLESSAKDVMGVLPQLDRRGALFSHECEPAAFTSAGIVSDRSPEAVIPPILDAFAAAGRPVAGRHIHGCTGAFWDADEGIPVLPTFALLALRDLALEL